MSADTGAAAGESDSAWNHPPICDGCGQLHALFVWQEDGRLLCPICAPPPAPRPAGEEG
jgi:hypothetical protein